ncbi:protein CIP2A isoform X2 [Amia ocellicauda]|uniref:protein CIP2A isoform X2 n=1 Tax=Amia ocellicauda TaxID=2972642 RepID=UPI003463A27F
MTITTPGLSGLCGQGFRMDATTCLKSLLLGINQYKNNNSATNAAQLQRQIDDVSGLKCARLFCPNQVLPSECVGGLVELAGDPNTSPTLRGKIVSLLSQLASNEETREALHSSYDLTSALASIIHCNSTTPSEPIVLQCIQVLQRVTYNTRIFHSTAYIDELIAFLMHHIQSPNDDLTMPCLGLLANLCRYNLAIQAHIKSTSQVKAFYRTLISYLAHNSLTVVVFALSLLTSLTLNEEVGEKLFHAKNIHQTFQLIFNIIVNGDGTLTRKYAVDLLVDLLKNPKIADYLSRYEHFSLCLTQVLGLLQGKDPDSAAKVLELLVSLCSVSSLRRILCQAVFRSSVAQPRSCVKKDSRGRTPEPGLALIHWASLPLQGPDSCCLQALQLLSELFEEVMDSSLGASVQPFTDLLLPVLLDLLQPPELPLEEQLARRNCARAACAIDVLLALCGEEALKLQVSRRLTARLCVSQVEYLFSSSRMDVGFDCPMAESDLSQAGATVVLKMLDLMSRVKQVVPDMETSFYRILQDQRLVTPLSVALTSDRREQVQTALRILFEAAPLPDFPAIVLGESIAANNSYRLREAEFTPRRMSVQDPALATLSRPCAARTPSVGSATQHSIHSLIERLQTGMEMKEEIKDVRISEIMDVYEQKISALASKEGRLQDLLEAKALALAQADRLIAQYRCQRAQAEAEARKLATLLKDAERRKEELSGELSSQTLEAERAQADIQQLLQHNGRLQAVAEEHQALSASYNDVVLKFGECEKMLRDLQTAHSSLNKQAEAMKKQNDTLKLQQEKMLSQLAGKEEKIQALSQNLEDRENKISGLEQRIQSLEEKAELREKQSEDMEETIDILRKELNKTELARKELSIKASSLELQKSQLETRLEKREEELNKHSHMIAMIHSLSSGKLKTDSVNLSL